MIDAEEVGRLATAHISRDKRYSYRMFGQPVKEVRDWTVGFEAVAPDGHVVGGPIFLVVDEHTGAVRSLHAAIAAGWRST